LDKINRKNVLPGCAFAFLLFLMCLDDLTDISIVQTFFKHVDELLVLFSIAYLVLHIHYVFRKKWRILYLWLGFMAIGTISSLVYGYQKLIPAAIDAVVVISKFMVGYLTAYVYASLHGDSLSQRMMGAARLITTLLFVISVHDLLMTPFFPRGEYRYFTKSLVLMFPHSTYLAAAMVSLLVLLGYTNKSNRNIPFMFMATFIGMMTLRGKAIAFFAVYWMLYLCLITFRIRNLKVLMAVGALVCVIIGFEQISDYFLTTTRYSPRQIMLKDSIPLALQHFPLGTGFGTFGSTIAAQNYSPLYVQLGYPNNDGMSPLNTAYLSDCFWPEIFAQFGFIGTVLFVAVLVFLVLYSIKTLRKNLLAGFSMLAILVNMLINSTAESSFFNPASFLLFVIFGLMEAENQFLPDRLKGGIANG
jgi:hypothetical protein